MTSLCADAYAYANIGIVKYWGKRNEALNLPCADSLGISIEALCTRCFCEWGEFEADSVDLGAKKLDPAGMNRVRRILDAVRTLAGFTLNARVRSENNFEPSSGLASSSSGMASLALASVRAAGLELSSAEISALARLGSGSAARAVVGGWAHWQRGTREDGHDSYAVQLFDEGHWPLRIFVLVVSKTAKKVSSTQGMRRCAESSPFWDAFQEACAADLPRAVQAIAAQDLQELAQCANANSMRLHAMCLSAQPAIVYWEPESLRVIELVELLAHEGIHCVCTFDAGPNAILLCDPKDAHVLRSRLDAQGLVYRESGIAGAGRVIQGAH